ncbi:MAG: hypothetical protein AB1489_12045 [Acidobacteriota bacterium]
MAAPGISEEEVRMLIGDIEEMINVAVGRTCDQVAESDFYWYLQTSFSTILSGGQVVLPSNIILQTLKPSRGGRVTHTGYLLSLVYLEEVSDLQLPKVGGSEMAFYALRGGNSGGGILYAADGTGASLLGNITILGCAYQTFETLAIELEDQFLDVLTNMAREKLAGISK